MMFMINIISVIIVNIQYTNQIAIQNTNDEQFITFNSTIINQYRKTAVHTIITADHIPIILNKLNPSGLSVTTELSSIIETSTSINQTFVIPRFDTKPLPVKPDVVAPDGSLVRTLLSTIGGSMAQFDLPVGMTSNAVVHRTVYEIWYFLSGEGEFWRQQDEREEIVKVNADICITIPVGTLFQFRTIGQKNLVAVAITMPPWPGPDEAIEVEGIWNASLTKPINLSTKLCHSIYLFVTIINFFLIKIF